MRAQRSLKTVIKDQVASLSYLWGLTRETDEIQEQTTMLASFTWTQTLTEGRWEGLLMWKCKPTQHIPLQ